MRIIKFVFIFVEKFVIYFLFFNKNLSSVFFMNVYHIHTMTAIVSKKLAIYYGWPSAVNGTFTPPLAAAVFGQYQIVVWGAGLESPTHPDHANSVLIIADPQMVKTEVYGYINSTDSIAINQPIIDNWQSMGVKGIFCDRFGYDFGVSRASQNQIVDYIHSKNLNAFVNAFIPDDAFSTNENATYNPSRDACHLGTKDWYLAESYQIINDVYDEASNWISRSNSIKKYKHDLGVKVATVTTTLSGVYDQDKFDYAYFSTLLYGFDACGWGEQNYSASSAQLPMRPRKKFYGKTYDTDGIQINGGVLSIQTNVGFEVNTTTHKVDYLID